MTDLMARIERQKLAALLEIPEERLGYLEHLSADAVRRLRESVGGALYSRHASRFARMASVSKMVPPVISAKASGLVGPALSAQVAGALDPGHAVKLAKAMKPEFLADVTGYLDPSRVTAIIQAMPPEVVVPVGQTLLARAEFLTLGRFTSVVSPDLALRTAEGADGMALLHLALYTEDREALDAIVTRIDDARLGSATAAAAASGEFDEALALMAVLSDANRARVIEQAASLTADERNDLLVGVIRNDAWEMLLRCVDQVSDDALRAVVNSPATLDAGVIDAVVTAARAVGRTEVFESVLMALDADRLRLLAASPALASDEVQSWLSTKAGLLDRVNGILAKL